MLIMRSHAPTMFEASGGSKTHMQLLSRKKFSSFQTVAVACSDAQLPVYSDEVCSTVKMDLLERAFGDVSVPMLQLVIVSEWKKCDNSVSTQHDNGLFPIISPVPVTADAQMSFRDEKSVQHAKCACFQDMIVRFNVLNLSGEGIPRS